MRRTSPKQDAASQAAAARWAERQRAQSKAARNAQLARQAGKTGAQGIQAHAHARGQRQQAKRDSR